MYLLKPALATAVAATLLFAGPSSARAGTLDTPPDRIIGLIGWLPAATALADDGTAYVLQYVDAANQAVLSVLPPGASSQDSPATRVIQDVGDADMSLHPDHGIATTDRYGDLIVIDPGQPAGPVAPERKIDGPQTSIDDVNSIAWAPDGSLWISNEDDGDVELLKFAPGADGDVAPVRSISGPATGLVPTGAGIVIDTLPDGAVVASALAADTGVLVFDEDADGNATPARRIDVPSPTATSYQFGLATDALGRIYVAVGDIDGGSSGHLYVYAAGAGTGRAPMLDLTGPKTRLHIPVGPSVTPDGSMAVLDAIFVNNEVADTRLLTFDPLPVPPSAPKAVKVRRSGDRLVVSWRQPADDGGAAITGYRVQVGHRGTVVLTRNVKAATTSLSLRRSALPSGRLAFQVSASNVAGRGPGSGAPARIARVATHDARLAPIRTVATIRAEGVELSGRVRSSSPSCVAAREVVVFKQVGGRGGGDDRRRYSDVAERDGRWSTGNTDESGRFYAKVGAAPACGRDVSPTVRSVRND